MKHLFTTARKNAKAALRGNWGRAVAIVLLTAAISILFTLTESVLTVMLGAPSFVDYFGTPAYFLDNLPNMDLPSILITSGTMVLAVVVLAPLRLGELSWYLGLTHGRSEEITGVFVFFESFTRMMRSIWLSVSLAVRYLLWGGLFLFPGVVLFYLSLSLTANARENTELLLAAVGWALSLMVSLLGGMLYYLFTRRYFLAPYILCCDRRVSSGKAIRLSIGATKGRRIDIALFELSFIGWYLLCILVLPLLYVQPYVSTARAIFARYLIEKASIAPQRPEPEPQQDESDACRGMVQEDTGTTA